MIQLDRPFLYLEQARYWNYTNHSQQTIHILHLRTPGSRSINEGYQGDRAVRGTESAA
jgi:hypothetical protein